MNKSFSKKTAIFHLVIFGLLFFVAGIKFVSAAGCTVNGNTYFDYDGCKADSNNTAAECTAACGPAPAANPTTGSSTQCEPGYKQIAGTCVPNSPTTGGFFDTASIGDLITRILKVLLGLAGMIAVGLVVVGGYQYITSAGNAEQAEKGRATLINAIIGLVIVMAAWLIITLITNTIIKGSLF